MIADITAIIHTELILIDWAVYHFLLCKHFMVDSVKGTTVPLSMELCMNEVVSPVQGGTAPPGRGHFLSSLCQREVKRLESSFTGPMMPIAEMTTNYCHVNSDE